MELQVIAKLLAEFLKVMCTDFDLLDILPAGSLRQNVCKGEEFMNRLDKLITGLKDIQEKVKKDENKLQFDKSTDKHMESPSDDSPGEMEVEESDRVQCKTENTRQIPLSDKPNERDNLTKNNVQIKASTQEIERRIAAFIEQKRQEVDEINIREFCPTATPSLDLDSSCARVDSVFDTRVSGKSHIKVTRVVNLQGPQTLVSQFKPDAVIKKELEEDPGFFTGIEERLQNIESHLKVNKREQRTSLFDRVKKMEERILFLESLSPEYFSSGLPLPPSSKRKRASEGMPSKFQDVNNMDLSDIDDRIRVLRESLRQRAMHKV
ncbi:MAP3K12-binding inhibitory protein 1-like isoform X2 [Ostrea edulis]|uniref:MAP3K12-binding inhibitory protein 1-like isoform X2 n=1 Tax=Ostrea edulis TaxID=37623 RepID=UPI0024AFDC74|nr:MAP3K12-binding inhibitory protein 1-like isoform X2 [Ostrea edulis]